MSNRDIIILASVFSSSSPLSPGLNPPGVPAQKEEEPSRDHRVRVGHLATFLDVCVCVCVCAIVTEDRRRQAPGTPRET